MTNLLRVYGTWMLFFFCSVSSFATHIVGGVITVRKVDNLQFEFTFVGYRDRGSTVPYGGGNFDFGDGNRIENIGNQTQIYVSQLSDKIDSVTFKVVHTYEEAGTYFVSYSEEYRNADIINMANSVITTFYVESWFDTEFDNSTPLPPGGLLAPFQLGEIGLRSIQFIDAEGDLLRYSLAVPMQFRSHFVNHYRYPDFGQFYSDYESGNYSGDGPPVFSLDRMTGTLVWDVPGDAILLGARKYTVAIKVDEYRVVNGVQKRISSTVLDGQFIVDDASDEYLNVVRSEADFCTDDAMAFEINSSGPYSVLIEPEALVSGINGVAASAITDSTFTADSEFTVTFTDFEEGQFVTFEVRSADEEAGSSFTYLLSAQCDQYALGSRWSSTGKPVLYPNPAAERLWIQTSGEPFNYVISGLDGKQLLQGSLNSSGKIDLTALKNGVYLIQLFSLNSKTRTIEKLIVKR